MGADQGPERARSSATRTFVTRSPEETEALGASVGRALAHETLITLDGDLGAGKTCFVRGLARGLDVQDPVSSPTYALLQTYAGRLVLHHFDAWMEGRERAFLMDGGLEWLHSGGVAVIEWAARVADVLPRERLCVELEHRGPHERLIRMRVEGAGAAYERLAGVLAKLAAPGA
jgi:tRNA threonylcarbamoyladenosine biosynthesis protein TsaE